MSKENTHTFIVRIWREPREVEDASPKWRGVIEQVAGRQQRYFKGLDEITAFVAPYLEEMGVKLPLSWQIRQWLRRWRLQQ